MQENNYYYNGIPLSKYCKDNDININTIRTRIWKMKRNKKYENYTEQEIINIVIEKYGKNIKYMYKGKTLRQYCIDNNIKFSTIASRIEKIKNKNAELSNDELVTLALEEFENQNYKFFYKGVPLKKYCESHPEINYNTIRTYINKEKEKNPELSIEEIIEQYINKEHKGIYKYYYCGIPLKQYCEENNINYKNIISYMRKYKNSRLNDDEFVEMIMEEYQPFKPKYLYNGYTLREYCTRNNLSYYSVISFVKRRLAKGSTKSIDELIDGGIKTINRYGIIYYYKGMPLKDYALENNLNVNSIRCAIIRKQLKSDKTLQEIVDECVETYQKFSIKYYYNGIPLISYCNNIGLNYNTIIQRYLNNYADNPNISIDDAIKQIVDYYIENPPVRTKYYFNNQSLSRFCDINGYPYVAIWRRLRTIENNSSDTEKNIELAIKKYEDKLEINKINDIFINLKNINDYNELKNICNYLKIDFDNVIDLVHMDFSYNQAINLIWYFSDKKNNDDYKIITDNKIKDIFILIDNLSKNDIEQFELYDLIGIYKSELYDSRNEILMRQKKYIYKTIYSLCRHYNIKINKSNYEDFESEIKYYLLKVIEKINLNIVGQIIKYIDLTIKGYFRTYLKAYSKQSKCISLNESEYLNDQNTKNYKEKIDFISDTKEDTSFSSDMMKVLSSLPQDDLTFIMLKYQENYSDEDLALYYKLTIDEIKEKEIKILSLLKNNEKIKMLRKKE